MRHKTKAELRAREAALNYPCRIYSRLGGVCVVCPSERGDGARLARGWNLMSLRKDRWMRGERYRNALHTIDNNLNDRKRRGQSNREGANNRRWRRYLASLPKRRVLLSFGGCSVVE